MLKITGSWKDLPMNRDIEVTLAVFHFKTIILFKLEFLSVWTGRIKHQMQKFSYRPTGGPVGLCTPFHSHLR
jgi:hypothetical protein